ncbi:MAG: hypothetical protein KAT05_02465 [Spirochaetes bacterium]|nr:hypothetical protein [Spirochaetota bacterium]
MNSSLFCNKCKKLLKNDNISKVRFCPTCEPEKFIEFKNSQRIHKRTNDGRNFIGVDNAGDIVFLNIDYFEGKCNLQFDFKKSEQLDIIKTSKNWTDNKIKTIAKIEMKSISSNNCVLIINGRGTDNRCTWCKSFRTVLTGYLNIEYKKRCRFD